MASWGGLQKGGGSSRLSRLVTDVRSSPEPRKGVESGFRARGGSSERLGDAGAQSDEEEEVVSEDEEEL